MNTDDYLDMEAGESGWEPVWITKLHPIECDECEGGVVERIVGESQGMGGIGPITRSYECEECEDGLLGCVECGETPAYEMPSFDRLCITHMKAYAADVGAYTGVTP